MNYNTYENIENMQKKNFEIVNQSISKILRPLKTNHILQFLIVLDDFQYIHWCCCKSTYDLIYLEKSKFPGNLKIVHVNELGDQYIIDGPVQTKTLYIKMPKENVYVESTKYQEKQFHSKFNELISIFSELNAKKVNFYFHNMDERSLQIDSKLRVTPSIQKNVQLDESNTQNMRKKMSIDFDRRKDHNIDINRFADSSKFYYLPKEFDWIEVIRNRINGNMKNQKYSFIFSNDYRFRSNFYDSLKKLEIEFGYASYKYNEIHIEYEVEYYSDNIEFTIGYSYMNPLLSLYQLLEKKKSE